MRHLSRRARTAVLVTAVAVAALVTPATHTTPAVADDSAERKIEREGMAWAVSPVPPAGKTPAPRNYFILEGDPGTVLRDRVLIQNFTDYPITFELYGADGYNTDGKGSFALKSADDEQTDLGKWIKMGVDRVTVYGKTAATVPVRFRIPENATPGDHVGGVVALNTEVETQSKGSMEVGIQRAIGARAYVRVSGNTSPGLEVSDVKVEHDRGMWPWSGDGSGTVTYTLANTGNLRLAPEGTVSIDGWGQDSEIDLGKVTDLLPGSEVTLTKSLSSIPGVGPVDVEVTYDGGEGLKVSESTSFTLVPWPLLVVLIALLAAAAAWWMRRRDAIRRRLRDAGAAPRIAVVESDEGAKP